MDAKRIWKRLPQMIGLLLLFTFVTSEAAQVTEGKSILRIHGSDRFETAIKISEKIAEKSDFVLLANGYSYPDGLTGSTLSGGKYPLLFTGADQLNEKTRTEIERLNPQMVILLGGESSISKQIELDLNEKYEVMRIGGSDRYETSELIRNYEPKPNLILASGENFADALVAAPLALSKDANIVLTPKQDISSGMRKLLDRFENSLILIGGEGVLSNPIRELIRSLIKTENVREIKGANRYETSVKIAEEFFSDTVIIASAEKFPDSLAGSVLAGSIGAPILLSASDRLDAGVRDYLKYHSDSINNVFLLGGQQTLSDKVVEEVLAHLSGTNYVDMSDFSDVLLEFRRVVTPSTVYESPDETSPVYGETYEGEYVEAFGESGGYLKIKRGGNICYILSNKTAPIEDDTMFKVVGGLHILNKKYYVPSDYAPGPDPEASEAFYRMQADVQAAGLGLYLESGYRSYWYQSAIYNNYRAVDGWYADRYSAKPGHSEHQSGRAFDVSSYGEGLYTSFENSATFAWLQENAHKYGFILRYMYGKEEITGYMYEPWHYTYVGVPLAEEIRSSGLSVEEYFGL